MYYRVEMFSIENNSHMLENTCYVYFKGFLCVSGTFKHKIVHIWFVWHETWYTTQFGIYCIVEMVRIENNSHML